MDSDRDWTKSFVMFLGAVHHPIERSSAVSGKNLQAKYNNYRRVQFMNR